MKCERAKAKVMWRQYGLPADLSEWIDHSLLIRLTLNAVQTIPTGRIDRAASTSETATLPPRMMLTLLTFCYAIGIYNSRDIDNQSHRHEAIRYLCARKHPGADYLRRFRNKNREVITGCLAHICCSIARMRFVIQENCARLSSQWIGLPLDSFKRLMQLQCLCEARERLTQADRADQELVINSIAE